MDRSKKDLQANEVRAIRIGEEAIVELLWETLQEMGESLLICLIILMQCST